MRDRGFWVLYYGMDTEYCVYILINEKGRRYIGLSSDVSHRLSQHNAGISRWTRGKGPWVLDWISHTMSPSEATRLERLLKRQKGGVGLENVKKLCKIP